MASEKISACVHTKEYRGDHSADVVEFREVFDDETLASLVRRLLPDQFDSAMDQSEGIVSRSTWFDYIVIRRVRPAATKDGK